MAVAGTDLMLSPNLTSGHQRSAQPAEQPRLVSSRQLMLPDAEHLPAHFPQHAVDEPVPRPVALNFLPPERRVVPRPDEMPRTSMPEATVHDHRQLEFWEHEVRLHGKRSQSLRSVGLNLRTHRDPAPPARDPIGPKDRNQPQLGVQVPRAPDAGHYRRPLGLGEDVRHSVAQVG